MATTFDPLHNNQTACFNPATGEPIGFVPQNSVEELKAITAKARIAQKNWAQLRYSHRAEYLFKMREYIVDNADTIAEMIHKDNGKTRIDALSTEVLSSAMALTYYAKNAAKILQRTKLTGGSILTINKRSFVEHLPFGVIGIISPWNYPFSIPLHEIAMALMAGNGVILKCSSSTLQVGEIIKKAVAHAALPEGLFSMINLPGHAAGDAFFAAGINKLFFTGSTAVGKELMEKASRYLIPVSLELGGNDAMIVCHDANIERSTNGALWGGMSNAGQSCAGVERVFIDKKISLEFISTLKKKIQQLRVGKDIDFNIEVGSLTLADQCEKVRSLINDAVEKGATLFPEKPIIMPETSAKNFLSPLILENVNQTMRVMNEEIFGPVICIQQVDSIDQAVELANKSLYGLTASVWTSSRKLGLDIASRLEVGAVMINDHLMSHGLAETPWGGFKQSGIGRTHGYLGLQEMTQTRVIIEDILPGVKKNLWWYPHNAGVYTGLKGGLEFLYSANLAKKISGLFRLMKIFMRTFKAN